MERRRTGWFTPPEWTREEVLEFPGWSADRVALWTRRLELIRENEHVRRIEQPVYKRRWDEQWKIGNRWECGQPAYDAEFLDAFHWWLSEKVEWWLEHSNRGQAETLTDWTAALWTDPRIRAEPLSGRVELYWGVIGMMARLLGVRIEPLTVVVLAHELSHAYTHLGADIDHRRCETADFALTAHELAEGLAQYYTGLVCRRLENQEPGAKEAYESLLQRQPPAYRIHEPWVADFTPEEVRFAMLQIRHRGPGRVDDFLEAQREARARLRVSESEDF